VTLTEGFYFVLGNVLGLLIGFMLGILIRASAGAIATYFVYSFLLPTIFLVLATNQNWFKDLRPWVDVTFAQGALFAFEGALTGEQWANIAVTGVFWMVIPLAVGLGFVTRAEVK
jgi:ABC-2 type transport system permease protein